MIRLLPTWVAVADDVPRDEDVAALHPAEAAAVALAVPKRRREFATGRRCARDALAMLRVPRTGPVLIGPSREPLWPHGVVGSITHSGEYCAVAVARAEDAIAVGIDAERIEAVDEDIVAAVLSPRERGHPARSLLGEAWPLLVFSAKESVFKALFPATRRWLDFGDVELSVDAEAGRFGARVAGRRDDVHGRFALGGGYVRTAVVIARARELAA